MANSGSVEIPMDAIQAQVVAKVADELLKKIQPQIEHTDQVSGSVRRRVTYGGGSLAVLVLLIAWHAWGTYKDDQKEQEARDKAIAAQYETIGKGLAETNEAVERLGKRFDAQGGEIRSIQIELNRHTGSLNMLYRKTYGRNAQPLPYPYPDLVTGASSR